MRKRFPYSALFMYGSLQSVGHTMDYFIPRTEKLVIFIIMPRVHNSSNMLRVYERGVLKKERSVCSSGHIFLYYFLWWWHHNVFLFRYFSPTEKFLVLAGHPIAFMGMRIVKLFRRVTYAYWVGDYFPPVNWSLVAFEKLKKYYHDNIPYTYYLSDRINVMMNGSIVKQSNRRTVMWGVKPPKRKSSFPDQALRLLFVGLIRPSQGIEALLLFVRDNPSIYVSIIGVCEKNLYITYKRMIETYNLSERVWFPNRFIDEDELISVAKNHHIGIALYNTGKNTATYYTDPGKIKTYIELGLPAIMTNTSSIAGSIKRYRAGVVLDDVEKLGEAIDTIHRSYATYLDGLSALARHLDFETYYRQSFIALEHL